MNIDSHFEQLIQRARGGDERAREELFARCRNYLNVLAQSQVESWLRAKVDASDLVQQTLLEAHQGLADFQGQTDAQWLAWLRKLLQHNAADFVRQYRTGKRQARREVPLGPSAAIGSRAGPPDPAAAEESPSQIAQQRERELQVADALAQLPPDYQEVVMLRNLQRLPFDQIAQRMGRSRPAVQMLWMRALRKLQELLGD